MGPVGSPEHAVGEGFDHAARERHDVTVRGALVAERGRPVHGQALGAAHLRPDVLVLAHEAQEQLELRPVDRLCDVGPAHVIDHDDRRQGGEEVPQLGQVARLEVDDDVPAEGLDAQRDLRQLVPGREVDEAPDEVEADGAHAGLVQVAQLTIGDAAADGRDAARAAAAGAARVGHRAVVGAVAGGLHDDVAREAQVIAQREQLRLARVAGRVLPLGREGKLRPGTEHVAMRVHGAGRRQEPRLAAAARTSRASRASSRSARPRQS